MKKVSKWTYKTCKEEASKYKSRNEFDKNAPGAYAASRKRGWLEEFFPNKNVRYIPIKKLDLEGNYIETFQTLKEASMSIRVNPRSLLKWCNTGCNFYGFLWETELG